MEWHPSGVARTRIRVIGVNFSKILIKRQFSSSKRGIRVIRARVNWQKMTKTWVEIQGKWDLVRVSGEFELRGSSVVGHVINFLWKRKQLPLEKWFLQKLKEHIKMTNPSEYNEILKMS